MVYDIPNLVWPIGYGKYKVVQFMLDKEPYLRFGSEDGEHTDIWEQFVNEAYTFIKPFIDEHSKNRLVGAGYVEINTEDKKANFSGSSTDFRDEIFIDKEHLELIKVLSTEWGIISA